MLDKLVKYEKAYYKNAEKKGYSQKTATDYMQKYGTKNLEKAQDTLDTFKNEGVSNDNVSKAGENLGSDGIDAYRDTITDNTGKFDNADESALLDLFEKCENKTEYDTLRNNVNTLEKYDIKPSEYASKGIDTPEKVKTVADAVETAINRVKAIGITDEATLAKISNNVAEAVSKESKFTEPALPKGGTPKGNYEAEVGDEETIRSLRRQNEAADTLAANGYDVKMLPNKVGGNGEGLTDLSNPDYLIDGEAFDCYSPKTLNMRTIDTTITNKTTTQARRIVLNLDDFPGTLDGLVKQLYDYPIDSLDELLVIKNGKIARLVVK